MNLFKVIAVVLGLCGTMPDAQAAWAQFQAANGVVSSATTFSDLPRGAGGFNQGAAIAGDNTLVLRTDTYGAYLWNPTGNPPVGAAGSGVWNQLITSSSMPADFVSISPGFTQPGAGGGVYEIQICYSNSQIMYMTYLDMEVGDLTGSGGGNSTVFKSTNRGTTWTRTAFTPVPQGNTQSNQDIYKEFGPKIAIDSSNCNHVYVGTAGSGLFVSTDGNTFSTVSTSLIPAPTTACASGLVNCGNSAMQIARFNSSIIYIGSGGNGVYKSTNGDAGPFTLLTGGSTPSNTNLTNSAVDESTTFTNGNFQGTFYLLDETNNDLYSWNATTWTLLHSSIHSFGVDPNLSGHLLAVDVGGVNTYESLNAGSTWATTTHQTKTGDIGWIANGSGGIQPSPWLLFDRNTAGLAYQLSSEGPYQITWSGNIGSSTTVTYNMFGRGIEQIVGQYVLAPSAAGSGGLACPVITAGWDFQATCHPNFTSFPSTYYPDFGTFAAVWTLDEATSDSSHRILAMSDGLYAVGIQQSAYTDNGGTVWTSIVSNLPAGVGEGGTIAASTSLNWCFGTPLVRQPSCTVNGGSSWASVVISGVTWDTNVGCNDFVRCRWIVADRVNQNQFTLMISTGANAGFYESTNSGTTWTSLGNSNSVASTGAEQMFSIPGQANHIWLASGAFGAQINNITGGYLAYTLNAGSTFTKVTNMAQTFAVGYGAAEVSYPDIYTAGWLKLASTSTVASGTGAKTLTITGAPAHTILPGASVLIDGSSWDLSTSAVSYSGGILNVTSNIVVRGSGSQSSFNIYVYGIWKTTGGPTASPIWTEIDTFPGGSLDIVGSISGDMNIAKRAYIAKAGSGFAKIN